MANLPESHPKPGPPAEIASAGGSALSWLCRWLPRRPQRASAASEMVLPAAAGTLALLIGLSALAEWLTESADMSTLARQGAASLGLLAWAIWALVRRTHFKTARVFQERLENLVRGSLQGIVIHRNHKPLFANQAYAEMYGFSSPDELVAMGDLTQLVSPEFRPLVVDRADRRLAGEQVPNRYELLGLRRDGRPIWVETLAMLVPWSGGPAIQSTAIEITERKRAEDALRLSEMSYRSLFESTRRILENSPAGIILMDRDLRVVYENAEARAMYGLAPSEFSGSIGRKLTEIDVLRGTSITHAASRLQAGRRARLETRVTNLRGAHVFLSLHAVPILEDERLAGAVAMITDITERRRQEEALRKQDRLLAALADARKLLLRSSPWAETVEAVIASLGQHMGVDHVMVFVHEGEQRLDTLRATLRHEWCSPGTRAFQGDGAFVHVSYRDSGFSRWHARFMEGKAVNDRIQDLPPDEKWLFEKRNIRSAIAVPVFSGARLWGFVGCADHKEEREWTRSDESILHAIAESLGHRRERDDAEERLRQSEGQISAFVRNVPVMMFQYRLASDGSESFPFVSRAGLEALGLSQEALKRSAKPMLDRIHPADRIVYERLMKESLRTMRPKRWEGRYYDALGEQRWAEMISRPRREDDGSVLWDGFITDRTGRKRAELEAMQIRERGIALGSSRELLARWLPPLRQIEGALAGTPAPGVDFAPLLEHMLSEVRRLMAQLQAPPPQVPAPLPALLAEAARRTLHGTDLAFQIDLPPDLDRVTAEPGAVRDIFAGLMVAALQAMPDGGLLSIRGGNVRIEGESIAGLAPGYYVRTILRGEPPQGLAALNRPPATDVPPLPGGTPPGLVDVLGLVTAYRGWLTVNTLPAQGPSFTLYLPSVTLELVTGGEAEPPAPASGGSEASSHFATRVTRRSPAG